MEKVLNHLYLFKGLGDADLGKIEGIAELVTYGPGERIFSQGDAADAFYLIQSGAVRIDLLEEDDTEVEIAKLGTGSHFGEMGMLDKEPRSASATSESYTDVIRISYDDISALMDADNKIAIHFYREISRFLASRLRLTSLDLSLSRSQNLSYF